MGAGGTKPVQRKEVVVLGEALFGRERLAFEVQELDFSHAAVRKLIQLGREVQRPRLFLLDQWQFLDSMYSK